MHQTKPIQSHNYFTILILIWFKIRPTPFLLWRLHQKAKALDRHQESWILIQTKLCNLNWQNCLCKVRNTSRPQVSWSPSSVTPSSNASDLISHLQASSQFLFLIPISTTYPSHISQCSFKKEPEPFPPRHEPSMADGALHTPTPASDLPLSHSGTLTLSQPTPPQAFATLSSPHSTFYLNVTSSELNKNSAPKLPRLNLKMGMLLILCPCFLMPSSLSINAHKQSAVTGTVFKCRLH